METYLVGGAVRDELLGKPVQDRDWVVVGATPDDMTRAGFSQVGADFPVFLHPETKEEYALARTERRSGPGHRGFTTDFSRDVTLEEDLARRDLTINAMARDAAGVLIDPYGGQADLQAGCLRAVTEAFREDPLRVLRVARFAAQLPGFTVEAHTAAMLREMTAARMLDELPGERIWQELAKALAAPEPHRFFAVVEDVNAWSPFFDLLENRVLLAEGAFDARERFASLCERLSADEVRTFCKRIKAPNPFRNLALRAIQHGDTLAHWRERPAADVVGALSAMQSFNDPNNAEPLLAYLEKRHAVDLQSLREAVLGCAAIRAADFSETGPALGKALKQARVEHLAARQ